MIELLILIGVFISGFLRPNKAQAELKKFADEARAGNHMR